MINVQQAIMGMVQHVQLVVTEELPHLLGLEQPVIVSTKRNHSKCLK